MLRTAADLYRKHGSQHKVIQIPQKTFSISRNTAKTIIDQCVWIYNVESAPPGREFWIDIHMGDLRKAISKAKKEKDLKTLANLLNIQMKTIK